MAEIVKRKQIWFEDDCTYRLEGHVTVEQKYKELTGEEFDKSKAVKVNDYGDGWDYFMPNGYIVYISWPGNCGIYREETIYREEDDG